MHLQRTARALLAISLAAAASGQDLARFTNLNRTFHIELPADFRQMAPLEATRLAADPTTPEELRTTSPHAFYAVGPIDRWLQGHVAGPWLYVMEQGEEWHVDGEFAPQLQAMWQEASDRGTEKHTVTDVVAATVGPAAHPVHRAVRTTTQSDGRAVKHLDVYAATGGKMVTLCFAAFTGEFDACLPRFEQWLSTLTFARPPRGEQKLSDRLWNPLLTGGLVVVILYALYRHTRRSR